MIPFIDLTAQYRLLKDRIDPAIQRVLEHGQFIHGPEVEEVEQALSDYLGVNHTVTCGNGTDAITLALMGCGVGPGHEVITPAFGFAAAAECVSLLGASVVLCDVDPRTFNLCTKSFERCLSEQTRAVIPIDLFGQCADYDAITSLIEGRDIVVIQDAAQSLGATYKNRPACGLTSVATTSFFPTKPLGCFGDGGAVFCEDAALAGEIRSIARHGQKGRYIHDRLGMNSRLDTLQAAVLLQKLTVFGEELKLREEVAGRYTELLARELGNAVSPPFIESWNRSVFAQYTILIEHRDAIKSQLESVGVPTAVHYPLALNHQRFLRGETVHPAVPAAEHAANRVLSLPMGPYTTANDQALVVAALAQAIELSQS